MNKLKRTEPLLKKKSIQCTRIHSSPQSKVSNNKINTRPNSKYQSHPKNAKSSIVAAFELWQSPATSAYDPHTLATRLHENIIYASL